ncbi:PepSY domain-containing protein [Thalassovita sp.]|uniref:PepSY domain-containing protein n=1 Tax=Thalassovita sp. TaxID=1979401 RepID=UPI0029DE85BC|nr:PepSY domain-containing protein [Thalassovita sp.]
MIRKLTAATLATVVLLGAATPVLASQSVPQETQALIRAKLTEQGYEVRKIKREDGLFEAYALKDGKKLEIYLDENLNVVRTKTDD